MNWKSWYCSWYIPVSLVSYQNSGCYHCHRYHYRHFYCQNNGHYPHSNDDDGHRANNIHNHHDGNKLHIYSSTRDGNGVSCNIYYLFSSNTIKKLAGKTILSRFVNAKEEKLGSKSVHSMAKEEQRRLTFCFWATRKQFPPFSISCDLTKQVKGITQSKVIMKHSYKITGILPIFC